MAEKTSTRSQVKEITDRLEQGMQDLFTSEKYMAYLQTMSRFHRYSTRNTLLIHMQKPDATLVAGFQAWQSKFGRYVKKGERSIKILAPMPFVIREERQKLDPDSKRPILGKDGLPVMEEVEKRLARFRAVSVFDVTQTDGKPLPSLAEDIAGDVRHYELFMDALKAVSPLPIGFEPLGPGTDGVCRYGSNIAIREGMSEIQTVSAVIHEITHAKLHDIEMMRQLDENAKPKDRNTEEVEAESVSYAVCQYYGIETGANSFGYIENWSKSRELKELNASLDTIRKTAAELIDGIDGQYRALAKEHGVDLTPVQSAPEQTADAPAQEAQPAPSTPEQEPQPTLEENQQPQNVEATAKYSHLQQKGFEIAKRYEILPMQDRMNIIAETFGCKTARIRTFPSTGKWRGTSDINLVLDNGAALFIGNYRTSRAKTAKVQNECVNATLAQYNPEILAEIKAKVAPVLLKREAEDNAIAAQKGLKPYTFLNIELNDGSDEQSSGHLGWYYVTIAIDGKIFALIESGLNYDIARGVFRESRPDYFVAGALEENEVDFVFDNVGHSSTSGPYTLHLSDNARERAEKTLNARIAERQEPAALEQPAPAKPSPIQEVDKFVEDIGGIGNLFGAPTPAPKPEQKPEKQYDLGYGHMGNGLTVWNRLEEKNGDYVTVAHIGTDRNVTFYDTDMPDSVKARIEDVARTSDMTVSATQDTPVFDAPAKERTNTPEQKNYQNFTELFPQFVSGEYSYLRLEAGAGMEPLSLEWIAKDQISVMHTYTMNGDLMYDPMITFKIDDGEKILTALEFEQSMPPLYQRVDKDGNGASIDGNGRETFIKGLQADINGFTSQWFDNIRQQGYMPIRANMEINGDETQIMFDAGGNPIMPEPTAEEATGLTQEGARTLWDIDEESDISPDPAIGLSERDLYGYNGADMLPLLQERASELFDQNHTIYMLHPDNTEAMVFDREEITAHDGIFGIDAEEWRESAEYKRIESEKSEGTREAMLLYGEKNSFGIYQLKGGDETRYHRWASLAELANDNLAVDRANYELVYTAPLDIRDTMTNLHKIYKTFNDDGERPSDFTGHSISTSDVIVLQWRGEVRSHYVDGGAGFKELPAFLGNEAQPEINSQSQEQQTSSQLGNTLEPPAPEPAGPTVAELEAEVKAGRQISLLDLARAVKDERQGNAHKGRPSILAQLQEYKNSAAQGVDSAKTTPKHDAQREV